MWTASRDEQNCLENWSNLFDLESKGRDHSAKDAQIVALEKRLKQMENRLNQRFRSLSGMGLGRGRQNVVLPTRAPVLALPAQPVQRAGQNKGRGRGKNGRGKGRGKQWNTSQEQNIATFRELIHAKRSTRPELFASPPGVCFAFNEKKCADAACTRPNFCVGCRAPAPTTTVVASLPELIPRRLTAPSGATLQEVASKQVLQPTLSATVKPGLSTQYILVLAGAANFRADTVTSTLPCDIVHYNFDGRINILVILDLIVPRTGTFFQGGSAVTDSRNLVSRQTHRDRAMATPISQASTVSMRSHFQRRGLSSAELWKYLGGSRHRRDVKEQASSSSSLSELNFF